MPGPPTSRLVLLTCVWKRPELTRIVLRAYRRIQRSLASELDLCLLAVGSQNTGSRGLCEDQGFDYIEHLNAPLSHKWNAGVQAAREYDPDGLVIVGSDDLLSHGLFTTYSAKLAAGSDFFGLRDLYFFDATTGRLGYWGGYEHTSEREGEPIGCGRCFSRHLLERTGWNLWPREPGYESLLDNVAVSLVKKDGFVPESWRLKDIGERAVDIKVGPNITPFHAIDYAQQWTGARAMSYLGEWLSEDDLTELTATTNRKIVK